MEAMTSDDLKRLRKTDLKQFNRLIREAHRERGRENFWYFMIEILHNPVLYAPLHKPLCDWIQAPSPKRNKLLIIPRGHIKSMCYNVGYICWRCVQNPNVRILICSHKQEDASGFMHAVREYMGSEFIHTVYPEIKPAGPTRKPTKWSDKAIRLERTGKYREHTVETTSTGCSVTGRHFDEIVFDDIVTLESVQTPELIEKTAEYHVYCDALLEPGGRKTMIGTRYDYLDEYGRILDTKVISQEWECVVLPAWKKPGLALEYTHPVSQHIWDSTDEGQPIFPTRFTMNEDDELGKISLPKLKRTNTSFFFNSQYMNEPIDKDTAEFTEEQFQIIKALPPDENFRWFRVCDLSTEEMTESFTAIVTGAVDSKANIYVADVWWGQFSSREIVDELIGGMGRPTWGEIGVVGFEPAPFERSLRSTLDFRMQEAGTIVPYTFLDPAQAIKAKNERIRGIKWWTESKKLFILADCRNRDLLIDEFLKFPRYARKDIADAMSQIPHIMWKSQPARDVKEEKRFRMDDEIQSLMHRGDRRYIGGDRIIKGSPGVVRLTTRGF